ncbi:hypothetical protein H2198_000540 [Neophaeococcomyces mojaviensis]|uniref:Uncharacterized protein n=1 Tax=Neophaeococcomyces mojaviensis TaxID=3383035 RepID=A0ACC3AK71_9EURO|nr:hypothetical protein H2198_000540 [Knufia sp. JES_112]
MEAAVRFSQNSLPSQTEQYFLKVDIAGRTLQVYNITVERKSGLDCELVYASNKLPLFRAFDWHPREASLVAVGQSGGEASLVNLADTEQVPHAFSPRTPRSCNAVGLNTLNWLAIGYDRARTDYCLNVWDVNQKSEGTGARNYGKGSNEPLHHLASGEHITSLRFFQDQPKLLAAGVKGQFLRLYDLREPTSTWALQFGTRCVNNIAIDTQDEHYFASCLPSNNPTVSVWDRRMISRTNIAHVGFGASVNQAEQHPEATLELKNVVDPQGQIWGLRFSKTHRGRLGVLSSTGQLRMLSFRSDYAEQKQPEGSGYQERPLSWDQQSPRGICLNDSVNFTNAYFENPEIEDVKRVVSFDFTTAMTSRDQPRLITLTGEGHVRLQSVPAVASPRAISTRASLIVIDHTLVSSKGDVALQRVNGAASHLRRSTAAQLNLVTLFQKRCEAGYLLDADKNAAIVKDSTSLETFWLWLKHAKQISADNSFLQGSIDMSFLGVFGFWMEEINVKSRASTIPPALGNQNLPSILRDLARRLNISRGKGCPTEFPHNRALCLYAAGLPWVHAEIEKTCDILVSEGEHTKAAATAMFAGEVRLAQKALRASGSNQSHKMLAMALAGARNRHQRQGSRNTENSHIEEDDSDHNEEDDWQAIISAISDDLTDPFAKAILTYVKSGQWKEVLSQTSLPLKYRVNVALRHFNDSELTRFLTRLKQEVVNEGNLEGVLLTGLGTTESIELLANYASITNDVQTAALGMSFAAASDRFLLPESSQARTVSCYRETYKSQLLSCGLKFDKARFDVTLARDIRSGKVSTASLAVRKKEQIRLICTHCNQSLSQFGHEQQILEHNTHMAEVSKTSPAPEKAAVAGTVCPKCGRHLPRCGVCGLWLGTPDETFSKWYKLPSTASQRNNNSVDLSGSMVGSTVTAIGPGEGTPAVSITDTAGEIGAKTPGQNIPTSTAAGEVAIEVVEEGVAKQEKEKRWYEVMHKFTVFCTKCSHGFHAEHARMWFDGGDGQGGHRACPVPMCECLCNG